MVQAFVTGGTGFLGINLVTELVARGDSVVAIHRAKSDTRELSRLDVRLVACGLDDVDALAAAIPESVDVVYHVAGDISWWKGHEKRQYATNVECTRNMVEAALRRKVKRFVHTSSISAFGIPAGGSVITEETQSNSESCHVGYLRTKWQGEQEVKAGVKRGLPAVIMNPANIFGPHDVGGWARLILLMDRGKLPGTPSGRGSFCHAVEVVRAHIAASTAGRIGENYLLGGADATFVEVGAAIARLLGRKPPRGVPAFALRAYGALNDLMSRFTGKEADITRQNADVFSRDIICDSGKAIRELGYVPRTLQEMLGDSVTWLRQAGYLRGSASAAVATG